MNKDIVTRTFIKGIASATAAWVFYGLFTSLFDDDTVLEQMFDSSGVFFAVCMAILATVFYYRKEKANEPGKES